jgi:selenide,water dikinase
MTEIAAQHALNGIYAMGAAPQAATLSLILPRLSDNLQARTHSEIMATADQAMTAAGAAIVCEHTSLGSELTIDFTLTGLCKSPITLAGARAGDMLILTKPLGSGMLMAAKMAGKALGADVAQALHLMRQSQKAAAEILSQSRAMTNVAGVGLIGHLQWLLNASMIGAELSLSDIPLMKGAEDLAASGIRSSIYNTNRMLAPELSDLGPRALLFDPQTSGGLLASVAPDMAQSKLRALQGEGYSAAIIGTTTETKGEITLH